MVRLASLASSTIVAVGRDRSRPRVKGTMQNAHMLLQPLRGRPASGSVPFVVCAKEGRGASQAGGERGRAAPHDAEIRANRPLLPHRRL